MSDLIFHFRISFLLFHSFKLFKHHNNDNFPHWKFSEFFKFFKLPNFKNFLIFEIVKFVKWAYFPNWTFFQFSKLKINEIFLIGKLKDFQNFIVWEINKFSEFFQCGKLSKFQKLTNFGIVSPFNIRHHSQFCLFSYLSLDMNWYRRFIFTIVIFYFSDSHKFGLSTFERSLIFKFEMSGILEFYC